MTRGNPNDTASYKIEKQLLLFGSYFFMSEEEVKHSRNVWNIMSLLGDFGGLLDIFLLVFVICCSFVNEKQMIAKSIRAIYFRKNYENIQ